MRKWLIRGTVALLVVLAGLAAGAWFTLRGSLPQLDGQLSLTGLSAPVTLQRDASGTVTIDAQNEADALRALGFVHAQERFFEMDLMRRSAGGELAALVGSKALDMDKQRRVHRLRDRVRQHLQQIVGSKRPQLDAYVEGINAGLNSLDMTPWPYLLLRTHPRPWRAEDTPLAAFAMYFDLQGGEDKNELALWKIQPHVPPALFALLNQHGTRWDAPLEGRAYGDAPLPTAEEVDLRNLPDDSKSQAAPEAKGTPGSNNFAVDGSLTQDGRAIVANDMHLTLRAPNIWFRARLRYPDPQAQGGKVDVQGITLPGLPLVIAGSNGHIAWGFTNSYIDTMDWKLETPCDTDDSNDCAPVSTYTKRIYVAHGNIVQIPIEETEWGPVLHRLSDGRFLTLRWAAHLPGAINLGLSQLAHARNLSEAINIAKGVGMPTQNLLVADSKGQIAWRLIGPVPQRASTCTRSASVEDSRQENCPPWPISGRDNPVLASPTYPRLWTANARVLDGAALAKVGDGGYTLGTRQAQIRDDLQAKNQFTERDLLNIQLDDRALLLTPWQQLLQERAKADHTPALQALAQASAHWEGRATVDSVSYRLVREWRLAVHKRIADGLTAPARAALGNAFLMPDLPQLEGVVWPLVNQRPAHLLPRKFTSWSGLFEDAASEVRSTLAPLGPLAERTWGERNTSAICHPLAGAIPFAKRWLCMPAQQLAGDGNMPRVVGPAFGASERIVVSPGHEEQGILQMPGGQSGHPLSPFWGAGHTDWVEGKPSPFLPGTAQHSLKLLPAQH